MRHRRWSALVRAMAMAAVVTLAAASPAGAAACRSAAPRGVTVTPATVAIQGALGEANTLTGRLDVTLPPGVSAVLQASELVGPEPLPGARVNTGEPFAASNTGLPQARAITLDGLSEPGTYTGTLTLITSDPRPGVCTVDLRAEVVARPRLSVLGGDQTTATLRLTRAGSQTLGLPLRNLGPGTATITSAKLQLRDADLRHAATGITAVTRRVTLPAGAVGSITLKATGALEPGRYTGALVIAAENASSPAAIPVDLKVKQALSTAIVLIVIGLLLRGLVGLAARYAPLRGPARELFRLRGKRTSLEPIYQDAFAALLARLHDAIYLERGADGARKLAKAAGGIHASLLEAQVATASLPAGHQPGNWVPLRRELLDAVAEGDDEHVRQVVARMQEAAAGAALRQPRESLKPEGPRTLDAVVGAEILAGLQHAAATGARELRAPATWLGLFVLPYLVEVLVAGVLVFVGLQTLYLSNDAFGADVLLDDIGLIVWTLGATAAGKVLGVLVPAPGR